VSMHARVVRVLALLCVFAVVPLAEAARSGTYRCILEVPQGGIGWILQYNPNSILQTVTGIRAWDSTGGFLDTGTIAQEIPANGSDVVFFWDGTADEPAQRHSWPVRCLAGEPHPRTTPGRWREPPPRPATARPPAISGLAPRSPSAWVSWLAHRFFSSSAPSAFAFECPHSRLHVLHELR
jgi:hypothetical protein